MTMIKTTSDTDVSLGPLENSLLFHLDRYYDPKLIRDVQEIVKKKEKEEGK